MTHPITVKPSFRDCLPPLGADELSLLEESLKKEGCRMAIDVWAGRIIDGHNRFAICSRLKIPFKICERKFETDDQAMLWIMANQRSRRNLTDDQRALVVARELEILGKLAVAAGLKKARGVKHGKVASVSDGASDTERLDNRLKLSKRENIAERKVKRAVKILHKSPELAAEVWKGDLRLLDAERQIDSQAATSELKTMEWPTGSAHSQLRSLRIRAPHNKIGRYVR